MGTQYVILELVIVASIFYGIFLRPLRKDRRKAEIEEHDSANLGVGQMIRFSDGLIGESVTVGKHTIKVKSGPDNDFYTYKLEDIEKNLTFENERKAAYDQLPWYKKLMEKL